MSGRDSAAIEAARSGVSVTVFDENARPGGQLFKQIHKFFGSKEHMAKIRGFRIGEELLREAEEKGVEVVLNATVIGLYREKEIQVQIGTEVHHYKADAILIATGASENMVNFRGWTLPGVIGAGAAQTMMNLYHVKPGNRILMLGSGNVGLVVSYQLMQAGCEVVALVDAAPRIGGYGVHASKVARCGVPFYLSHFDVDTICVAVGLSPMTQLLKMDGVEMADTRGGYIPACDETGATSIPGIFAAGDVAGIEEASSAMIEGRMSGEAVAAYLGYASADEKALREKELEESLGALRQGMFAPKNRGKKLEKTDEGIELSEMLLEKGYIGDDEIKVSRIQGGDQGAPGPRVHTEYPLQSLPDCMPEGLHFHRGQYHIAADLGEGFDLYRLRHVCCQLLGAGDLPRLGESGERDGSVSENPEKGTGEVTIPYEFLPLPEVGEKGYGLSRSGQRICDATVRRVRTSKAYDGTALVTIEVPIGYTDRARFYRKADEAQ